MLEYVYFDFKPFNYNEKVSSVDSLLKVVERHSLVDKFPLQGKIAKDASKGLLYLHERGIVHRDIKPANILVSNQHYCDLENEDRIQEIWNRDPIQCKLADFGESRSLVLQTTSICKTSTRNIVRGTPVFRAPEILTNCRSVSVSELKAVDMWALGMVFFVLINPDVSYPYQKELRSAQTPGDVLKELLSNKEHPKHSIKYCVLQATDWIPIWNVYEWCTRFDPRDRPDAKQLVKALESSNVIEFRDIPLSIDQNSALEKAAFKAVQHGRRPGFELHVPNDGTNSCAFLSVNFAHQILKRGNQPTPRWIEMAVMAEKVIDSTPLLINHHRNISRKYDVMEAYQLLRSVEVIDQKYYLTEEIISGDSVYSPGGRRALVAAVHEVYTAKSIEVGIYSCGGYIFTIGCQSGRYFIMETHTMTKDLGGNGGGLLKVFAFGNKPQWVCEWAWKRLKSGNVKSDSLQSFTLLKRQR
jgi:hypothetical protein